MHAFLDGRDTPPKSAEASLAALAGEMRASSAPGTIASICGRYYAMDRDQRWERVAAGLPPDHATAKANSRPPTAVDGLRAAYARGETDEFVKPTAIVPPAAAPARMSDGDAVVFMNFRADRARQMTAR